MAGPKHSCGVVGMNATYNVVPSLQRALLVIQHRGQESAGLSVFDGKYVQTIKNNGLVDAVLNENSLRSISGNCGVGHVRYSTTGSHGAINAQPLTVQSVKGTVAIAHNGDITNYHALRENYFKQGWSFLTDSDSEIIARILSKHLYSTDEPFAAIREMMSELDGAYALAIMINGRLFGVRDPHGIRPLCIGKTEGGHIIVSESAALISLGAEFVRDVEPGEIVEIKDDIILSDKPKGPINKAHCMFEWTYFARPDSVMDGRCVYDVRKKIGIILARESPADVDLVMPIPDSGRAHAIGYSVESGVPYEEGFMKNRFVGRTFILPDQSARENAVAMKMNPIRSTIEGKRILIVDDSIVRGTTLMKLIKLLRSAGAKEVHVRIGCPPVIAPCYYGVDMKTRDQFIACTHTVDQIRQSIGADSLAYISIDGLVEALEIPKEDLCLACVDGIYPTRIDGEKYRYD